MYATELKLQQAITEGNDFWRANDFKGMLNFYLNVHFLFEDAPPEFQRFYYCNLAVAHYELKEFAEAAELYGQALKIRGEENESDISTINANLADTLLFLNRPDEALIYLSQPEEYHRTHEPLTDKKEWARRLGNALETKARALLALGDESALDAAQEAEELLFMYCRDDKATGRAIRTLWMCWEGRGVR